MFNVAPLVTERTWALGFEAGSYGAVFVTLKGNTAIQSMRDFPGRRVGTGGMLSVTFQETWKVPMSSTQMFPVGAVRIVRSHLIRAVKQFLSDHGLDLFLQAKQVRAECQQS